MRTLRMHHLSIALSFHQEGGVSALYKGMMLPVLSSCTRNAINFSTYNSLHNLYHVREGWDVRNCLAGAAGAPLISTISTVENFIKVSFAFSYSLCWILIWVCCVWQGDVVILLRCHFLCGFEARLHTNPLSVSLIIAFLFLLDTNAAG